MKTVWSTPQRVFDKLNWEFGFSVDLCATEENRKCKYYLHTEHSLDVEWQMQIPTFSAGFLNPPYGREISTWLRKARRESSEYRRIVALIPGRTNAPWWHAFVMKSAEVRFVRKKMAFDDGNGSKGVPSWGSVIVVFAGEDFTVPKFSTWEQP